MQDKNDVKVYGADWCGATTRTMDFLDQLGVKYEYINVERDKRAAEWVKRQADGKEKKPTLDVAGTVMVTPDNDELEAVLREHNLMPAQN